jgi:hypothetical protein
VATFTFEVRKAETIRYVESVSLQIGLWLKSFRDDFDDPGSQIMLKEDTGEIVICVGIATARKAFERAERNQIERQLSDRAKV